MFSRTAIFRSAWSLYGAKSAAKGDAGVVFSRRRFALCLFTAWADAKLHARIAATMAAEAAEFLAAPARAAARDELFALQMQDGWRNHDFSRAAELQRAIAA